MEFDDFFGSNNLPEILKKAKTLSKNECNSVFEYMRGKKEITLFEFGTQKGCSAAVFLQIGKYFGIKMDLHSWDIKDLVQKSVVNKKDFTLHIEDITNRERVVFDKYRPNLVFLDAHPYELTKNIVSICLERKIDFMCHDVSLDIYERTKNRTCNLSDKSNGNGGTWELPIMGELISESLLTHDSFENEKLIVNCVRDKYGLAIIKFKR